MLGREIDDDLELRLLARHHADELFALFDANREHLAPWLPWVPLTKTADDTRAFIDRSLSETASNGCFNLGIWWRGEIAGCVGMHLVDWPNRRTTIGYWLGARFQGKGIMTRCCRAVVDHGFREMGLHRIGLKAAVDNPKSCAIAERLGMKLEGVERDGEKVGDRHHDMAVYAILAHEWNAG